jgi:hypothetical protein
MEEKHGTIIIILLQINILVLFIIECSVASKSDQCGSTECGKELLVYYLYVSGHDLVYRQYRNHGLYSIPGLEIEISDPKTPDFMQRTRSLWKSTSVPFG